ncbi:hypothetical protein TNCV_2453751 [Trichonephila clavipes]|nr:hypothetical protein TNCV_2453751 [Trichonephila clavipes]
MDYFTKWPDAYPIPKQEASTVAEVLVQHWISRFGVPLQLHSDQGRNFDSAVCRKLCEILAIDKTRTTALYPQSDGMVERFNRTILNSLSLLVSRNQQDWDEKLPFFLLAYRSSVRETTGYSPSQMLFGIDLRLPADLRFSRPPDAPLAPEEYIEKLQAQMAEMHHLARERIGMASEKMKTRYDARATGHDFRGGDKVWLWNPKRRKGLSPKLQTNWEFPYTVLKRLIDVVVRIQKSPHSKNQRHDACHFQESGSLPTPLSRTVAAPWSGNAASKPAGAENPVLLIPTYTCDAVDIDNNHPKKLPETTSFYNSTKFGVDIAVQMAQKYSVKAGSMWWPVHVFYNILDLAGLSPSSVMKSTRALLQSQVLGPTKSTYLVTIRFCLPPKRVGVGYATALSPKLED